MNEEELQMPQPRESNISKTEVHPPMEETTETMKPPRVSRLLKVIRQRLSRRNNDSDFCASSSSNESISEEQGRSDDHSSHSKSESSGDGMDRRRRHRSIISLKHVLKNLTLSPRSQSCSAADRSRPQKKKQQPQSILRPPVTYTYVRGLSGLPTQRVPRHTVYCASGGHKR